jgi:hypothetical protein
MITIIIWIINAKPRTYCNQWNFLQHLTIKVVSACLERLNCKITPAILPGALAVLAEQ